MSTYTHQSNAVYAGKWEAAKTILDSLSLWFLRRKICERSKLNTIAFKTDEKTS